MNQTNLDSNSNLVEFPKENYFIQFILEFEQFRPPESVSCESDESREKTIAVEKTPPELKPVKKRSAQWYPPQNRPRVIDIEIEGPDEYGGYGGYPRPPMDIDIIIDEDNYGRPPYYGV